jgi:hypothetical protein
MYEHFEKPLRYDVTSATNQGFDYFSLRLKKLAKMVSNEPKFIRYDVKSATHQGFHYFSLRLKKLAKMVSNGPKFIHYDVINVFTNILRTTVGTDGNSQCQGWSSGARKF